MDEPLKYNESWKDKGTNLAYDSIYTQHLEKANGDSTQMNRDERWEREQSTHGAMVLWVQGNILLLHCGNGCIIM